jgi:AmmeMemoRadiSam system protein B
MEGEVTCPKMRGVEIFPAEVSGQKVICLRDPLNLSGKILFVPYPTFFILSLFDGQHSVVEIQTEFMRRFGELLYREKVEALMGQLDEHFLLENERFRQAESRMVESFKKSRVRPMALAGESYEGDGQNLKDTLASFFVDSDGPGLPHAPDGSIRLSGAIAPHIDYRRGGPCYAWAHRQILESPAPDLFIILGTAHSPMKRPFALTRKHFQTPWGPVETDQAFLSAAEEGGAKDFYEDEWVHKNEHSIELQLIFLRAFWERPEPLRVVPILCGSFHEAVQNQMSPGELPGVGLFIEALKFASDRMGKRVCFLASADLAHVGLRFGDSDPPDRFILQTLAEEDRRLLGYAERVDAEGFFGLLSREGDRRRVCGLAPIYILLRLLEGAQGRLLKYSQSLDPAGQSVVTFASMAYFAPRRKA